MKEQRSKDSYRDGVGIKYEEYIKIMAVLYTDETRKKEKLYIRIFGVGVLFFNFALVTVIVLLRQHGMESLMRDVMICYVFLDLFLLCCVILVFSNEKIISVRMIKARQYQLMNTDAINPEKSPDDRGHLNVIYRILEDYYKETGKRASRGFYIICLIICLCVGFLFSFIASVLRGYTELAYITGISSMLTQFIATVCIYFYHKSNSNILPFYEGLINTQQFDYFIRSISHLSNSEYKSLLETYMVHGKMQPQKTGEEKMQD